MPVTVRPIGGKYRIVDPSSGKIEMTPQGHPRDGGGHETRNQALRQMRAMNAAHEDPDWRKKSKSKSKSKSRPALLSIKALGKLINAVVDMRIRSSHDR